MPGSCGNCGKEETTSICAGCKQIFYCNVTCQTEHWKEGGHKRECKKLRLKFKKNAFTGNSNTTFNDSNFDVMSESIINKICSYLDFKSYFCFQKCSKVILSASQTPLQIVKIHSQEILKYIKYCVENKNTIDKNKFTKVSSLWIDVPWEYKSELLSFKFPNLLDLSIFEMDDSPEFLSNIINLNNINFKSIQKLYIFVDTDSTHTLLKMLQNIANLKYLLIESQHKLNFASNKNCLHALKGLSIGSGGTEHVTVNIFSNAIECCNAELLSLHFDQFAPACVDNINFHRFNKLEELCWTCDYNNAKLINIISGFKYLKRLRLGTYAFPSYEDHEERKLKMSVPFLTQIFMMNTLEHVEMQILDYHTSNLIQSIQCALMKNGKDKLTLVIRPIMEQHSLDRMTGDICIRLKSLMETLKAYVSKRWTFVLDAKELDDVHINNIQKLFSNQSYKVRHVSSDHEQYFVVSDKKCSLYYQKWVWKCHNCNPY